jgi:ubiquinone/menaquinone biosynthesis C-methylase UbiE
VLDVGAGLGHLALPLAQRGFRITAVEPAIDMLAALRRRAESQGLMLDAVHGMAEALPFDSGAFDLVVVADVVHFLDSERAAKELSRVLAHDGALAVVCCDFADTPFMNAVVEIMRESAPRRPREVSSARTELLAVARVGEPWAMRFRDDVPVDAEQLRQILRSISFIGPAMSEARFRRFWQRVVAVKHEPRWSRTFLLEAGRR